MLLRKLVRTDSELNALCLDYFPDASGHFADGMNRLSKVNLLLELTEPADVLAGLRKWCKDTQDSHTAVDQALAEREPEEAQRRSELREKLEDLYLLREQQRLLGQDLSQLDSQIVAIKRKQRQSPQLQEGEVLDDRYRLIEVIGRGGFGRVWQAFDRTDRRLVAVKVLHVDQGDDPRRSERFIRGARQMKALEHPHIVRVLDGPAEYHGFHYFVMDYLSGGDLAQAVTALSIDRQGALRAILAIGDALAYAHERHLIHRDIKPQNILLDGQGNARLTDFDLVRAADTTGGTATGFLGTHVYVAPEQAEDAKSVDERADLYALAMTTLFVLHGRSLPLHAVYKRALFIDALNCSEPARALLRQATAIEADDRPASVAVYCRELTRCFADLLVRALPVQPAALLRTELPDVLPEGDVAQYRAMALDGDRPPERRTWSADYSYAGGANTGRELGPRSSSLGRFVSPVLLSMAGVLALAVTGLVVGLVLYPQRQSPAMVACSVSMDQPGLQVMVDDKFAASSQVTGVELKLAAGEHKLWLSNPQDGARRSEEKVVQVSTGQGCEVALRTLPATGPGPGPAAGMPDGGGAGTAEPDDSVEPNGPDGDTVSQGTPAGVAKLKRNRTRRRLKGTDLGTS